MHSTISRAIACMRGVDLIVCRGTRDIACSAQLAVLHAHISSLIAFKRSVSLSLQATSVTRIASQLRTAAA